ncbi:mannose-1-phosphate guanylyltransferase/mannose-6-phosphate isomerase [soil metagenome]
MKTAPAPSTAQFIPAIISGGSGTRLWPVSRQSFPKQFAEIFGDGLGNSLFARAASRLMPLGSPWTITVEELRTLTEKSLIVEGLTREQALRQTLYEPRGRNTAPAIAFLCRALELQGFRESIVGVFPADQLIEDENGFRETVLTAIECAVRGDIVTLGITPTFPATGYGYIETSGVAGTVGGASSASVPMKAIRFCEKPNEKTARHFLDQGNYLWNAGMFVFKLSRMIELLKQHAPKVWTPFESLRADYSNLKEIYDQVEAISFDYAVMEKLESHVTIPCKFGWNDVGSWDAVADVKEGKHSVLANSALAAGIDAEGATAAIQVMSENNFVFPTDRKTYAFVGVNDLVVVDTQDATLIVKRGQSEKVKEVVDRLKSFPPMAARRATEHAFEIRPWGKFEVLKDTPDFKSKVITVDAGQQISYQSHAKRAEHWTIIKGSGEVVLNDEIIPVHPGSHVFIPLKAKHRIRNTGTEPLTFVEVQLGTYFGEDDIVRFEDSYGRK